MFSASHPRYRHRSGAGVREQRGGTCHFGGAVRLGHQDWPASLLVLRLAKTRKLGVVTLMGKQGKHAGPAVSSLVHRLGATRIALECLL